MMGHPPEIDPYWQHDVAVDVPSSIDPLGRNAIRFKVHQSTERYTRSHEDLVRLSSPGECRYFHGKPYRLIPAYRLTIDLAAATASDGEVGVVRSARQHGVTRQELGNAQGWYYPAEHTLVLWECFIEERFRSGAPWEDPLQLVVWQAWERFLIAHSPGVRRMVTAWEDDFDRPTWQRFLEGRGYHQVAPAAFLKATMSS